MTIAEIDPEEVSAFLRGDKKSFGAICNGIYPAVYRFAVAMIHDNEMAKDITAETLTKIWLGRAVLHDMQHIRSFAYRVVKNACLDHLQAMGRRRRMEKEWRYLSAQETPAASVPPTIQAYTLSQVYYAVSQLPPQFKAVCELILLEGKTTEEVAGELALSKKTVLNYKQRAVHLIRSDLKRLGLLTLLLAVTLRYSFQHHTRPVSPAGKSGLVTTEKIALINTCKT